MSIRPATHDDVQAIVQLGHELFAESPTWSRLDLCELRLSETVVQLIDSEDGFAWVAERRGEVVGCMLGLVDQHWASNARVAQELVLMLTAEARGGMLAVRLITALVAWAQVRGAKVLHVGTSTGIADERVAGLYERLGFSRCSIGLEMSYVHGH
jgi:GNAT superfamily N-acetyltransferase